ncbi:MAG: hypothetical protein ACRD4Q_06225, partial [Candidatus Acidiferrales bacterium]
MGEVENSNPGAAKPANESETGPAETVGDVELETNEPTDEEQAAEPGLFNAFRQSFERGWGAQRDPKRGRQNRQELRKDKTKALLALAGFTAMMILMFILVFSSPPRPKLINNRPPGMPDLGRRVTPGQGGPQANVTPLMNATPAGEEAGNNGLATAQDIAQTARPIPASSTS